MGKGGGGLSREGACEGKFLLNIPFLRFLHRDMKFKEQEIEELTHPLPSHQHRLMIVGGKNPPESALGGLAKRHSLGPLFKGGRGGRGKANGPERAASF